MAALAQVPARPALGSRPVKVLDRKHQDWLLYNQQWAKLDLLHEGGIRLQNSADTFLIKRPKELFDVYQERIRRFTYKNILGNCVGWYMAKLFQKNPKIDPKSGDKFYADFLMDCDLGGTTFIDFWRGIVVSLILYRSAFVLVDKPRAEAPPESLREEQDLGLDRVYLCAYNPMQAINWSQDAYGNLNWIVLKTVTEQQDSWDGGQVDVTTWYVFDRQNAWEYEVRGTLKQERGGYKLYDPNGSPLGDDEVVAKLVAGPVPHVLADKRRVPVRQIQVPAALWLGNRAYLELVDHLNQENSYAWALFMANLAMPVVIGQSDLSNLTLTEAGFIHLTDPQAKFAWTEPEGRSFQHSQQRLDTLREEVYRSFYLQAQARTSSATAQSASGFSKEMDMAPANDVLNGFGDVLRAGMQLVLADVQEAHGDQREQADIQGFSFEVKPALAKIGEAQAILDLGLADKSPTLEKAIDKTVALAVLDDANDDTKDQVLKEIEDAPTRAEAKDKNEQQQQQTFLQRFQRTTATGVLQAEQGAESAA